MRAGEGVVMGAARKGLSARKRFEVFKRDGFACQYCGAHPPQALLHVDHIVAVAAGGGNEADNLVTACSTCNLGKGAKALSDVPKSLHERAAEVAERERQLAGFHEVMQGRRDRIEDESWSIAQALRPKAERGFPRDWKRSIVTFLGRLPYHEVLDAMEIAASKYRYSETRAFLYFCGICWRKIKGFI